MLGVVCYRVSEPDSESYKLGEYYVTRRPELLGVSAAAVGFNLAYTILKPKDKSQYSVMV